MSYPEPPNIKNRLVFEQGPVADGQRREYKVLQLEFEVVQDWKLKSPNPEVHIALAKSSKEALNTLVLCGPLCVLRPLRGSDGLNAERAETHRGPLRKPIRIATFWQCAFERLQSSIVSLVHPAILRH